MKLRMELQRSLLLSSALWAAFVFGGGGVGLLPPDDDMSCGWCSAQS